MRAVNSVKPPETRQVWAPLALKVPLKAIGDGHGDEIITAANTFWATVGAIAEVGAKPVFIDCDDTFGMNLDLLEGAITPRTKAIMPVQLTGNVIDMPRVNAIAAKHGLKVVEDACQSLYGEWQGRRAGSFGIAAGFSMHPLKIINVWGDAGIIVTNDDAVYDRMLQLHDHGRRADGEIISWGLNSRLDNLQAAILDYRLDSYPAAIQRRRELASLYEARLGEMRELTLPPGPHASVRHFDVFQNYEIEAERRDALREHLKARGIGTLVQWGGKAVHEFKALGFTQSLPNTERLFTRCLMIPMNLTVSDDDVRYVASTIREFYGRV